MTAEAIRDSNPILHDLRHERWLSLGGKGDVPNLGMAHSDCLEEITAEYFEGEPLQSEGFDRLVGRNSGRCTTRKQTPGGRFLRVRSVPVSKAFPGVARTGRLCRRWNWLTVST